jgi:hypothetical protein
VISPRPSADQAKNFIDRSLLGGRHGFVGLAHG